MTTYTIDVMRKDYMEMTVNGIPYHFDNRSGKWSIWNISIFVDSLEHIGNKPSVFMDVPRLQSENTGIVLIKKVVEINPKLYKMDFLTGVSLKITRQLYEPGRSSNCVAVKMVDIKSGSVLLERSSIVALLDINTRKSVTNPDWFIDRYSYLKGKGRPAKLSRRNIPNTPTDCFKYTTIIRFSDLDKTLHVNESVYLKFCIDCASAASLSGKLVHFKKDMTHYPVLNYIIDFLRECFVFDEISLSLWQDEKDMSRLNFSIFNVNNRKQLTFVVCVFRLGHWEDLNQISKL